MVEHGEAPQGGRSNASTPLGNDASGIGFVECRALRLPGAPEPTLGTLLCRHGGALRLVVVAKVALDMKSSPMVPVAPPPIHTADLYRGADVIVASDLVPGRTRVDVTVDGHVRGQGHPGGELRARLALRQNGATVIDKTSQVLDEEGTGVVPLTQARASAGTPPSSRPGGSHDPAAGFGALGADGPVRQRYLTGPQRALLSAPVMTLADDLDWRFFQAAPADQQVDELAPDAVVVLEGMSADRPRLEAQLPSLRPRGGIVGLDPNGPDRGHDLNFRADSLHIHADQNVCVVTWRAVVEVPSEALVPSLSLTVGIEPLRSGSGRPAPGTHASPSPAWSGAKPLPFQPSSGTPIPPKAETPPSGRSRPRHGGTLGMDEPEGSLAGLNALPFSRSTSARPAKPKAALRETVEPSSHPAPPSNPLPFDPKAKPTPASPPSPAEQGPVLRGQTVDVAELEAMGADLFPFGQPAAPAPHSAPTPPSAPAPPSAPPPSAPSSDPPAEAAPSPPSAPAPVSEASPPEEAKPKRPAERVYRTPSHDDSASDAASPRRAPRRKKRPVQRARKRVDVNALLYQKKS